LASTPSIERSVPLPSTSAGERDTSCTPVISGASFDTEEEEIDVATDLAVHPDLHVAAGIGDGHDVEFGARPNGDDEQLQLALDDDLAGQRERPEGDDRVEAGADLEVQPNCRVAPDQVHVEPDRDGEATGGELGERRVGRDAIAVQHQIARAGEHVEDADGGRIGVRADVEVPLGRVVHAEVALHRNVNGHQADHRVVDHKADGDRPGADVDLDDRENGRLLARVRQLRRDRQDVGLHHQ